MKAALVIIFNHRFEKNVQRLKEYYAPRFSNISYLMPFASSEEDGMVRVFENSYCFSGHIAQGAARFKRADVSHYIFAGDDLILNPTLDETSILDALAIDENSGYIKSIASADEVRFRWRWALTAYQALRDAKFDWRQQLPDASQAKARFEKSGLVFQRPFPRSLADLKVLRYPTKAKSLRELYWDLKLMKLYLKLIAHTASSIGKNSEYPLLAGYSDFVVVPAKDLDAFVMYCGTLAALNIFAEVAVPTALGLACESIRTELPFGKHFADMKTEPRTSTIWKGEELWEDEIPAFCESLKYDWAQFLHLFPDHTLYYHPIKLSRWK